MRIRDFFDRGQPVFSFEFFPPRTEAGERSLLRTIENLRPLAPSFVSVTYGAGGSTREKTLEIVSRVKREHGIEAMAHLTCVGHDRDQIAAILDRLAEAGLENVLPLRGDPPRGDTAFVKPVNGFGYACELVRFIKQRGYGFCLAGAAYPEGHPECRDLARDVANLRTKVDAGVEVLITQLFYDNTDYFAFVERARAAGITTPILPGIMPITNVPQIERIATLSQARIPDALRARMHAAEGDDQAVLRVGIEHALAQCRGLLAGGAPGVHFYTLNQSPATAAILAELRR
ncbi:MAG: methylenetetrahydrofolate reductase [NAD(P)H] [Deltaproteobacteria bacterium]|nr:methylenetetrahydrofolate reductase [NAD(P)H] [Deltaproteobacteria bacterium]